MNKVVLTTEPAPVITPAVSLSAGVLPVILIGLSILAVTVGLFSGFYLVGVAVDLGERMFGAMVMFYSLGSGLFFWVVSDVVESLRLIAHRCVGPIV